MRVPILIAGALALTACSNNDQHDNTVNVDENLTAENIVSNDVTAIDAVTGDASNMAEAAAIDDLGPDLGVGNLNVAADAKPTAKPTAKKEPAKKPETRPAPKTPPAATTTTANTSE